MDSLMFPSIIISIGLAPDIVYSPAFVVWIREVEGGEQKEYYVTYVPKDKLFHQYGSNPYKL